MEYKYKVELLENILVEVHCTVHHLVEVKLPVAQIAGSVFVRRAARASTDAVDVLIAL